RDRAGLKMRNVIRALAIAALAFTSASTAAYAAEMTPALKQLAADANKEGELALDWSAATLGGAQGAALFEAGINKMFGTNIHIKFTPGPSMPAVGNDIAMRDAAGQPAPTDVWIAFSRSVTDIMDRHLFQAADWHALMPDRISPNLVEADGVSVKATTSLP